MMRKSTPLVRFLVESRLAPDAEVWTGPVATPRILGIVRRLGRKRFVIVGGTGEVFPTRLGAGLRLLAES